MRGTRIYSTVQRSAVPRRHHYPGDRILRSSRGKPVVGICWREALGSAATTAEQECGRWHRSGCSATCNWPKAALPRATDRTWPGMPNRAPTGQGRGQMQSKLRTESAAGLGKSNPGRVISRCVVRCSQFLGGMPTSLLFSATLHVHQFSQCSNIQLRRSASPEGCPQPKCYATLSI